MNIGNDILLNKMVTLFIQNGSHKDFTYPEKLVPLKLKIQSAHLLPGVSSRKNIFIPPQMMILMDQLIDSLMEAELFYMAEIYSRATNTVQNAITDFLIKYDLDEHDITHDALDKRIKRAINSGKIDVVRRKKHHHLRYSNMLNKALKHDTSD